MFSRQSTVNTAIELQSVQTPAASFRGSNTPVSSTAGLIAEDPGHTPAADVEDVPDGGYGWVVVAACSIMRCVSSRFQVGGHLLHHFSYTIVLDVRIRSLLFGELYSWGVTQAYLSRRNVASDSTLAFVGSTAIACVGGCAILSTHVIRHFGTRNAAILASTLMTLGQLLSSWSTKSLAGLFITNGLILGMGCSLGFMVRICRTLHERDSPLTLPSLRSLVHSQHNGLSVDAV